MNKTIWSKLPIELVSKILVYRPIHPCAALMKESARDDGSYTFTCSLEYHHASDFRRHMARYGYTEWDFNMNERSMTILGIYGRHVNEQTGDIADCIIEMLIAEEDALYEAMYA